MSLCCEVLLWALLCLEQMSGCFSAFMASLQLLLLFFKWKDRWERAWPHTFYFYYLYYLGWHRQSASSLLETLNTYFRVSLKLTNHCTLAEK